MKSSIFELASSLVLTSSLLLGLAVSASSQEVEEILSGGSNAICTDDLQQQCQACRSRQSSQYNCSLPGLQDFVPGQYEGTTINYLSFVTETSSPSMPIRAAEFTACTGGKISFSEAGNVWEDPVKDLGTKTARGSELYDGYFMSYSHFPEVSSLGLAETLNDRIRNDNGRLKWEDVFPKVRSMGEYRTPEGETHIDFLMYDGDYFVPLIRLDLLEEYNMPLPNTWEEVVEVAKFFHGKDLNGDGEEDFGFCHFPRLGAGDWDWWFSEVVYSTWATSDQTQGLDQGFFFDPDTMEPNTQSEGFRRAVSTWKDLWNNGNNACDPKFELGRCAVGYAPPGCWKGIFLNGVKRSDNNGTKVWEPQMKSGEYAEPYRFKPFGSLNVVDTNTGQLVPCTPDICPKAERVPARGHHGDDDRASVLVRSPIEGRLINRAPFYWSGGLGTLIRKSAAPTKKDMMWDYFVYTNSPETSTNDVASYSSWLDSWRISQLEPGDNFIAGGWSQQAYEEHLAMQKWGLSSEVNGALNLRIPGVARYTRDVVGDQMKKYIAGEISIDSLVDAVTDGWNDINDQEGKLDQLRTYRAALGRDAHSDVELCRLHRKLMDDQDPSVCRQFDEQETKDVVIPAVIASATVIVVVLIIVVSLDRHRRQKMEKANELSDERDEVIEVEKLVKWDNLRVTVSRVIVVALIIASGISLSIIVSQTFASYDRVRYQDAFEYVSSEIERALVDYHQTAKASVESMAIFASLQSGASALEWPTNHFKNFDKFASHEVSKHALDGLGVITLITQDEHKEFVDFETMNCEARARNGHLSFHGNLDYFIPGTAGNETGSMVLPTIYGTLEKLPMQDDYAVVSYRFPPPTTCSSEKLNFKSGPTELLLNAVVSLDQTLQSAILPYDAIIAGYYTDAQKRERESMDNTKPTYPRSMLMTPVHSSVSLNETKTAAILFGNVAFDLPLVGIMSNGIMGAIDVVFQNTCNQSFTYKLFYDSVIFAGLGDMHAAEYDNYGTTFPLEPKTTQAALREPSHCRYTVTVYPTTEFEEAFVTIAPSDFIYIMVSLFVAVLIAFLVFDHFVRKRNNKHVLNAAKSTEIVTSMFPEEIKERLLNETKTNRKANRGAQKVKSCLRFDTIPTQVMNTRKYVDEDLEGPALAQLYLNTTILFADICGFTAWSSSRQPEQVFELLETVFRAFDMCAKKNKVYKVETVGDCYVAVTGAPKQQDDHMIRMCRFSRGAMKRFNDLKEHLVRSLGPDTAELDLRIGIHTGQVTAGVLRGDRSRFQLFGDTMNTAARMESTSQPGRIQLSREAADLLLAYGKELWMLPRENTVLAKGKGVLDTFWLDVHAKGFHDENFSVETSSFGTIELHEIDDEDAAAYMKEQSNQRLVDWNVETLLNLLKKIIAHRQKSNTISLPVTKSVCETFGLKENQTFLTEVAEIIHLPAYNGVDAESLDLSYIQVSQVVVDELRELVEVISSLYFDNPFHNFEHASHVTMSVIKLLSRIVKPSEHAMPHNFSEELSLHRRAYGITSDPLTQFACAFSALVHDSDHPGVPNAQLLKEDPTLCERYDHRSMAEQKSLHLCFDLLMEDRFKNLRSSLFYSNEDQERFRNLMVNSVMATDICDKKLKDLRNGRWKKAFDDETTALEPESVSMNRKATIVIEHLIQASDVAHTMQHWNVYRKWNERLFEEMYVAYTQGRAETDPTKHWAQGEIGFFDFYIIPLAKKLKDCGVFGVSSDEYLNYALANRRKWEVEGPSIVAEMIEKLSPTQPSSE